jgi:hypothetical protein
MSVCPLALPSSLLLLLSLAPPPRTKAAEQQRARQLQTACRHRRVRAAATPLPLTGPYRVLCIAVESPPVTCSSSQPDPPELEALECSRARIAKVDGPAIPPVVYRALVAAAAPTTSTRPLCPLALVNGWL